MIETPARIEPCAFEDTVPARLVESIDALRVAVESLGRGLHPDAAAELADVVRMMNCYYSNLIEGHNTRPLDIERALANAAIEPERRPLALEARAHVTVQREIDRLHSAGRLESPTTIAFLAWVHRRFYEEMPKEFRRIKTKDGAEVEIVPGEFRSRPEQDNAVGRHIPPSSKRVASFMAYFEKRFTAFERHSAQYIIAIPIAHHRLNYIHPFPDGNGRVSRLMSHAMALKAGLGGGGLWSISRGLARGLKDHSEYKQEMDLADTPRQSALDGRGNLSERALLDFCLWFNAVELDQIKFMVSMFELEGLEARYLSLLKDLGFDERARLLVSTILRYGTLERGAAVQVLRTSERTARNALSKIERAGFVRSNTPKTPVRIAFPLDYRERLFPSLFADS